MDTPAPVSSTAPVLILGAGVNGACVARELVLNGVPVFVVDVGDIAGGATAKSSRLIHGGLRYLEYGEFRLVRESLAERRRLLELAPQFVKPLRLHIPLRRRRGGILHAACRFVGLGRVSWVQRLLEAARIPAERGLWAGRIGLWLYDCIAGRGSLPPHEVARLPAADRPPFDPRHYRWVLSYWDAQMEAPERFVVALLRDAAAAAREQDLPFEVLTYHRARLEGEGVVIEPVPPAPPTGPRRFRPAMIVNATGAWGDLTLAGLPVPAPRLFGGTRGSHILSRHPGLRGAIGTDAVYAEAPDGRLVFILPWREAVLIGTTDERDEGDPAEAVATEEEIAYLVRMVQFVFPGVDFTAADVEFHYSGIRPLPYVPEGKPSSITRDHGVDSRSTPNGIPIETLIGGKLTTCRAFGEQAADRVLARLGRPRRAETRSRIVPGGSGFPSRPSEEAGRIARLAEDFAIPIESAACIWRLFGTEAERVLQESLGSALAAGAAENDPRRLLRGTQFPLGVVDWIIPHEWVRAVADLVERRLLLVFEPGLTLQTLQCLEQQLRLHHGACARGAEEAARRLQQFYGIDLTRPRD